jgi:hypothetical protein
MKNMKNMRFVNICVLLTEIYGVRVRAATPASERRGADVVVAGSSMFTPWLFAVRLII